MDKNNIHRLIARYFEAETSVEEEHLLLKMLLRSRDEDPLVDEALAVMGYTSLAPSQKNKTLWLKKKFIIPAAAVVLIFSTAVFWFAANHNGTKYKCYAYMDGIRIENQAEIASLIKSQLNEVAGAGLSIEKGISDDLEDMRQALNGL